MGKPVKILLIVLSIVAVLAGVVLGSWFWYDTNIDRSGWALSGGVYSYRDFHGDMVSGWYKIDGNTYYFSPEDHAMATYWQDIDGKRYYFSGDGTRDEGFWDIEGNRYYFGEKGVMATSWTDIGENRYYFGTDGAMARGWQDIGEDRYHFRENGIMDVGRITMGGEQYRFQEDGALYTGWDVLEEELVYYLPEGPLAKQWQQIDGELYYFGADGVMETGWLTLGEDQYYLKENGAAAVGPVFVDGQKRYFGPQGVHVVLVNESHKVPDYYKTDLKTVVDWNQVSTVCYDNLVKMLTACNNAGFEYTFNSAYRTVKQQQKILDDRTKEYEADGMTYGEAYAKARETVALPGTSEHHLGLAVDLLGEEAIAWFHEHCWEYGFIVRYREEKAHITGIIDEPWHFRYVGVTVAQDMKDSPLCLEEYLGAVPVA